MTAPANTPQPPMAHTPAVMVRIDGVSKEFVLRHTRSLKEALVWLLKGRKGDLSAKFRALDSAQPVGVELHRSAAFAFPFFGVLAPIYGPDNAPLGAIWLVLHAQARLAPLLETLPNTPADTVAALQKQVATAIQQPAIRQKLIDFGIEPWAARPSNMPS